LETPENFDPNGVGIKGSLFGLPYTVDDADLIILPVPWEVTVSYSAGTADGPEAILDASSQVDLYMKGLKDAWKLKMAMMPINEPLKKENLKYRDLASSYINWLEEGGEADANHVKVIPQTINDICEKLNVYVSTVAYELLAKGKIVGLLGGDHSTPIGLIRALSKIYPNFGILQIDAHADLRINYEDFVYSHASIMHNALKVPQVEKLVQVGIRDICDAEVKYIENYPERIHTFYDQDLKEHLFSGGTWQVQCEKIIESLPDLVYISLDIDGLEPFFCPNTGTPVPGGLSFDQVTYLIKMLARSGKKIIGFDLNEVSPGEDEWDANVGARLLYFLSCWTAATHGKLMASSL